MKYRVRKVEALLTREQAVDFFLNQLNSTGDTKLAPTSCWHYGKCELYILVDAIYGPNHKGALVGDQRRLD